MKSASAERLYQRAFEGRPVFLTGTTLSQLDLASDRVPYNATELFLKNEPLVMAAMRAAGVDEAYITGDTSDFDKLKALAEVAPLLFDNTAYLALNTALSALFDCHIPLNGANCEEIWGLAAGKLEQGVGIASLLRRAGVCEAALPKDPLDLAPWQASSVLSLRPVFAPLRIFGAGGRELAESVRCFGKKYGITVRNFEDFGRALSASLDAFVALGCRSALHPLVAYVPSDAYHANEAFAALLSGKSLRADERAVLSVWLVGFLGREYLRRGMTLRFVAFPEKGVKRYSFFEGITASKKEILPLLDYLLSCHGLPRTVLCADYGDLTGLASLCTAYPALDGAPRISLALDDRSPSALCASAQSLAQSGAFGTCLVEAGLNQGLLAPFFAQAARHALCDFVAQRYEKSADLANEDELVGLLSSICGQNAARI